MTQDVRINHSDAFVEAVLNMRRPGKTPYQRVAYSERQKLNMGNSIQNLKVLSEGSGKWENGIGWNEIIALQLVKNVRGDENNANRDKDFEMNKLIGYLL